MHHSCLPPIDPLLVAALIRARLEPGVASLPAAYDRLKAQRKSQGLDGLPSYRRLADGAARKTLSRMLAIRRQKAALDRRDESRLQATRKAVAKLHQRFESLLLQAAA
jgi:hypothetical protein